MVLFAALGLAILGIGHGIPYGQDGSDRYATYMLTAHASTGGGVPVQFGSSLQPALVGELVTRLLMTVGISDLRAQDTVALGLSVAGLVALLFGLRELGGASIAVLGGAVLATDYTGALLPASSPQGAGVFILLGLDSLAFAYGVRHLGSRRWGVTAGVLLVGALELGSGVLPLRLSAAILGALALGALLAWLLGLSLAARQPAIKAPCLAAGVVIGLGWLAYQGAQIRRYPPVEIPASTALADNPSLAGLPFSSPDLMPSIWYYTRGEPAPNDPRALICVRSPAQPATKCGDWIASLARAGYPLRHGRNLFATSDYAVYMRQLDIAPDHQRPANVAGVLQIDGADLPTWLPDSHNLDLALYGHALAATPAGVRLETTAMDPFGNVWGSAEAALDSGRWSSGQHIIVEQALKVAAYAPPVPLSVVVRLVSDDGQVLPLLDSGGRPTSNQLTLGSLSVAPAAQLLPSESLPNAINKPIEEGLALIGFRLDQRTARAGDVLSVSLFWQMKGRVDHIPQIEADGLPVRDVADASALTQGGWYYGVMEDRHELRIPPVAAGPDITLRVAGTSLGSVHITSASDQVAPLTLSHTLDVPAGDFARLLGYDAEPTAPGGTLYLRLAWRALKPAPAKYKAFVHVLGTDGRLIAQEDHVPGGLPTDEWWADQVIPDSYAIALPSEGSPAQIEVGLYEESTGRRATSGSQVLLPMP